MSTAYISDESPPRLVPLAVVDPPLSLLQHSLPRGAVLQGKLTQDPAEAVNADVSDGVHGVAQEQQERMEPAGGAGNG